MMIVRCMGITVALLLGAVGAVRAEPPADLAQLQARWAETKYELPEAQREASFAALAEQAAKLRQTHPAEAPYLVWEGIIRATYAGARGGLGALGEAKKARALFEQSIALDPTALAGSAYTSLGSLYYQVPGWPIGFGDDDKAEALLRKGLEVDPQGIDANFFWGDFLLDQDRYDEALAAFEKAGAAPARPGRESADAGRRAEIHAKIAETQRKM
jgi:tetratricopeptide (TPR) repeat protein